MPRWILDACRRLVKEYGGDAEAIWIERMDGCDVAVDIHLRRVFLRTGLVERDDARTMVEP